MLKFLKYVLATIVGLFIFSLISILILVKIADISDKKVKIKENSVLRLKLTKPIVERSKDSPFSGLDIPGMGNKGNIGLLELKKAILHAKTNPNIKGIYLETEMVVSGFAKLEEIRNALIDFKKSGKFIVAYGENYTEGAYYLTSVADHIYLNPIGLVELNGLNADVMFVKGLLEKIGVKPEIFKVGEFKSAVEPLILDKMSEPSRLQTESYLNSLYNFYLKNVAASRNISFEQLNIISDSMLVKTPEDALKYKLITQIGYEDEVETALRKTLKVKTEDKINFVTLEKYNKFIEDEWKDNDEDLADNKIAVVFASGEISSGKGEDEKIGSESLAAEIRKLRLDKKVKAIVLRINSPGGSALASDVIWREVVLTQKVKPIIASMSDVAASGGYYIAMACDTIVAQPNTITGSIGIFGVLFNVQDLLNNKLGITVDGVKTGAFSDLGNGTRPLRDNERRIIQNQVERGYEIFTTKAAQGRHMDIEALKKIASGRVWSGLEAKENGLVDVLGGLEDAIQIAATKAKLKKEDYRLRYYPQEKNFFESFFKDSQEEAKVAALQAELGELYPFYQSIQKIKNIQGVQARMPYDIIIK